MSGWRLLLFAIAVCTIAVTVVILLPARWFAGQLAERSGGRVSLVDVEGTLWNGSAAVVIGSDEASGTVSVLPGRLYWKARAGFSGIALQVTDPELLPTPVAVTESHQVWHLASGRAHLPLPVLVGLGTPFNTLHFTGTAEATWDNWTFAPGSATGHASITLERVASQLSTVDPLGSYRVDLEGNGPDTALKLSTVSGPLFLEAAGTLDAQGAHVRGTARAAPDAHDRLADLLGVVGRYDGNVSTFGYGRPG